MKVSGFTFIRNAVRYDYPVSESIRSILPLCDEFVVAVGNSDDGTRALIESIGSSKIRIVDTVWDESLRQGGAVLAMETGKAFDAVSEDATWAFYLQADEVVHEQSHSLLRNAMDKWKDDPAVEGLLFGYLHFYGSYDYFGNSRRWYRNEVRIIRKDEQIRSYKDAQGFRKNGKPLQVKPSGATIHHYGWVKPPESQRSKLRYFHTLWHNEEWLKRNSGQIEGFDYSQIDSLSKFTGTHPAVMKDRLAARNWEFNFDPTLKKFSPLARTLHFVEKKTGYRVGEYRNFRII